MFQTPELFSSYRIRLYCTILWEKKKQVITCSQLLHPTALLTLSLLHLYTLFLVLCFCVYLPTQFVKHVMCCTYVRKKGFRRLSTANFPLQILKKQ